MQQNQQEIPENVPVSTPAKIMVAPLAVQDQRKTLKFGFSSKSGSISKVRKLTTLQTIYGPSLIQAGLSIAEQKAGQDG